MLLSSELCVACASQICEREGIPVSLQAPSVRDLELWEGAAISSTSRLLLPVDEVSVPQGVGRGARQRRFATQPLMRRLEALVLENIKSNSETVVPEPVHAVD